MIFDKLSKDVLKDNYFMELYTLLLRHIASIELLVDNPIGINEKQMIHLLRFSDILSNSTLNDCRNMSYRIVAFLSPAFKENPVYKTYSTAILSKIGNFPAIKNLNLQVELPFVREIEKDVKKEIQRIPGTEEKYFTDSQYSLFERLKESNFYSFSGPTSMGKSFIIKTFIHAKISNGNIGNFVVVVPTRALINQFSFEIKKDLSSLIDLNNYKVTTNSMINIDDEESDNRFILVLTPERLLSYLSNMENPDLHYIFVDEAHKLAAEKDYRSITMYLAIEKCIKRFPNIKIYFASPNVSNPEAFLELFNKSGSMTFSTIESPVTQNLFFIDLITKTLNYYNMGIKHRFSNISIEKYTSSFELIYSIGDRVSNVIYCNSVENTISKAKDFCNFMLTKKSELAPIENELQELILETKKFIHKDYYLADCLEHGIAFHFGNLPQIIRNKVEKLFKKGAIKYLFCTSTLLEGVNLPAKNMFILSNKKHKSNMSKIDFWNLAGRAGRLNYELYGNVFCVREDIRDWKNLSVIEGNSTSELQVNATKQLDKNEKNIEQVLQNRDISSSETEKEVLKYLANIISIDTLDDDIDYKSPIISKLVHDGKNELLAKARDNMAHVNVPQEVLKNNQSIMVKQQNNVYNYIITNKNSEEQIKLPSEINYNNCLLALELLHEKYSWETNESKKNIGNKPSLKYYALLINQWINGLSLSEIIHNAIHYYEINNRQLMFYSNGKPIFEIYNKSKRHNNKIINDIISDIENVVRYKLEKYFNNYHALLVSVLGENNAGPNWNVFLEYGTRDTVAVHLQNMGFSRHVSSIIVKNYRDTLNIKDGKLLSINRDKLNARLVFGTPEYDEITMLL